ncbi:MAG: IPT/TIG domain-containing protein [Terracidiphilus sp.]|jgi:hypothetical protein
MIGIKSQEERRVYPVFLTLTVLVVCFVAGCGSPSSSTSAPNKTTPTITWATPASVSVGTALSATQLNATASVSGSFVYTPAAGTIESQPGTVQLSVLFTPTDTTDYDSATATVDLNVLAPTKTTPTITWMPPASVPVGTVLSATQLDATASVAGSFAYSPSLGTVESTAGPVLLSVTFTPTDSTDYNNATASVTLAVTGTPTITWPTPSPVLVGTELGATQLDATASAPGTFVYTPPAGTVESTSGNVTLSVTFTPTDTADYTVATASVNLVVAAGPAIASISAASAPVGWSETITGSNFGASQGTSTVKFGSTPATVISWSNTVIAASVPSTLPAGVANITVSAGGASSNAQLFTVVAGQPTCSSALIPLYDSNNVEYIFENNEWNSSLPQCAALNGVGFALSTANFAQTSLGSPAEYTPATYPDIFYGCHWGNCTSASTTTLPIQESQLVAATTSVDTVETPTGYAPEPTQNYDVAYDIWFNQTPTVLSSQNGQPNGTEVMIWFNHNGTPQPAGSKIASNLSIAGSAWDVWVGTDPTWNIVSYVQDTPTSFVKNLDLTQFFNDAQTRNTSSGAQVLQPSWYLIDVEMGFEVWDGGQGLEISNYSVSVTSK